MIFQDDRSDAERASHQWLVIGTDSFMSGWGAASAGASVAAWACRHDAVHEVEQWVRSRREMKRVRIVCERLRRWRPKGAAHVHVYVVNDGHPSLKSRMPVGVQS